MDNGMMEEDEEGMEGRKEIEKNGRKGTGMEWGGRRKETVEP